MNQSPQSGPRIVANLLAVLGTFFILAGLIWIMYHYTQPGPVDQAHLTERQNNLAELRARDHDLLANYAYTDASRGVVRLAIARAMELTVVEWQNPAAGRSNLLAHLERTLPPAGAAPTTNTVSTTNAASSPALPKR
jgi:hypothetical protein